MNHIKKMIKKIYFITLLLIAIYQIAYGSDYDNIWGNEKTRFISQHNPDSYIVFKVKDEPEYKNRIIDFFTSMDSNNRVDITIVRINGKPEIDYCFFNEKLYSVCENWGNIAPEEDGKLIHKIETRYTAHSVQRKNTDVIHSFKKNKTKVIYQQTASGINTVRVKIFYYSTDIFKSLFYE